MSGASSPWISIIDVGELGGSQGLDSFQLGDAGISAGPAQMHIPLRSVGLG